MRVPLLCAEMYLSVALCALVAVAAAGSNYAVLIAGSNTWENYRHQADICHSYQVMIEHGIPKENIITFMYNDIANNPSNPTPGVIINQPGGKNVYDGVVIDYQLGEVQPGHFLNVLKGNATAMRGIGSGRVLNSTEEDNVFINFSDHGGPGIIAFPSTTLSAKALNEALQYMYDHKMFNQLVFYLEACESGSMFNNILPKNISIFATTAANPTTSSYACYYDSTLGTYLGDVYSVNWMQNSDSADLSTETLLQQYQIVKKETNTSEVCKYGEQDISKNFVADFIGPAPTTATKSLTVDPMLDAVDARDVRMAILHHRLADAADLKTKDEIKAQIVELQQHQAHIRDIYRQIVETVSGSTEFTAKAFDEHNAPVNFECLDIVLPAFNNLCFVFGQNDYALKYAYTMTNLCDAGYDGFAIVDVMASVCSANNA
eukprot:m.95978 g.95978  ORF g.95978 m.95978 type:complete len:432 (-) comp51312_c0_seq1:168-1463(-)